MKKVLFILLGFVLMFTLVGCGTDEPDKPDTPDTPDTPDGPDNPDNPGGDTEKGLTVNNLKDALLALEKEYQDSKKASVKVNLVNGTESMEVVLTYEIGSDNLFSALQYELKGEKEVAVYIKDGIVYSSANGSKSKETIDATINDTLTNDYGLNALLAPVTKFYNEAGFYACLTRESEENGVYVFNLDLVEYAKLSGTVAFNPAGKDSIKLIVTTVNEKITEVKVEVKEGDKTLSTDIKYLGFNASPAYPEDLDSYK